MSHVNPAPSKAGYSAGMINGRQTGSEHAGIGRPARRPLIYVVDDDHDVLSSLQFLLEAEGFDVRAFRSGSSLLTSPVRSEADCLVVDYKMLGIDGLGLAQRLRGMGVGTPIILITGYPDDNIHAKAASAGVWRVLLKPNLENSLAEFVRCAIAQATPQRQPDGSDRSPP